MGVVDDTVQSYLQQMTVFESDVLKRLEKEGAEEGIPNVDRTTAALMRTLMASTQPKKILEIGTAIGYSAIHLAESAPNASIFTIEKSQERAERAVKNIDEAGLSDRVHVWTGDAMEIMPSLKSTYDVVFIDAAKGKYSFFLDIAIEVCRPGGMILVDNVLFRGFVAGKAKIMNQKHQALVAKLQSFNEYLMTKKELVTSIVPIGDGLAICVKKG